MIIKDLSSVGDWELVNCFNKDIQQVHEEVWEIINKVMNSDSEVKYGLFE